MAPELIIPNRRAALATLVSSTGGTPREIGARMWVDASGGILGSVTIGGCVDAEVIEQSSLVLAHGEHRVLSLSLGDMEAWELGMTCGGSIEVLVEPVDPEDPADPIVPALEGVRTAVSRGIPAVIVAPLKGTRRRLLVTADRIEGTLGDPLLDRAAAVEGKALLGEGASGVREVGAHHERLYFERHAPPVTLLVIGATHVAMPLVRMARILGMRTAVVDGRESFATAERFPDADEVIVGMPSEVSERLSSGRQTFVVLLAHDYKYDLPVLRSVLAGNAGYIGVLGSRRRGRALLQFLAEDGVAAEQLARVHVPVGLDIGARSPEEIALAILAEALTVTRGRGGGLMRNRP